MIYICEDCGFLFQRVREPGECPICDKRRVHVATEEESKQLLEYLALTNDAIREEKKK